jgi:hypothetical protein
VQLGRRIGRQGRHDQIRLDAHRRELDGRLLQSAIRQPAPDRSGDQHFGKWKRTDGSAWGELNGPVQGNVLHFEWTEHKIGLVGPSSTSKGKGYFVYKRPPGENVDDTLEGEWGLDTDEAGNKWDCVKQRHVTPDLKSIGGVAEPTGPSKDWK